MSDPEILTPETVKQLRDAGPKDLVWLICDSHESLRAALAQAERERDEARQATERGDQLLSQCGRKLEAAERLSEQRRVALRGLLWAADRNERPSEREREIARSALADEGQV